MPGFEEEVDAILSETGGPRPARRRTLVLPRTEIVADGPTVTSGRASVVEGEEYDASEPLPAAPKMPARAPTSGGAAGMTRGDELERDAGHRARAQELDRRGRRDEEFSPLWDALQSALPVQPTTSPPQERTAARLSEMWRDLIDDPGGSAGAAASGAMQGASMGTADELIGGAIAPGDVETQRAVRGAFREGRAANPYLGDVGRDVTGIATGIATGQPSTAIGRIGAGAAGGALAGAGYSDVERPEDAFSPMLLGGGIGAAGGALAETPGLVGRAVQRGGEGRDEALLAATTSSGRGRGAIESFDPPGSPSPRARTAARARAAETLRGADAVPAIGTPSQVRQRIESSLQRSIDQMDAIRSGMDGEGPTGAEIARRLREAAARDQRVTAGPQRQRLEQLAEAFESGAGGARGPAVPIDYDSMIGPRGELAPLMQSQDPVDRALYRILRDSYDDAVEETMGAAERGAYQQARREYATLTTALENATSGEAAAAGNRGIGMSELGMLTAGLGGGTAAGQPIAGGATGIAAALGARALRATEPTIRATTTDALYQLARSRPAALGRYATPLLEAGARGAQALAVTHHMLLQRDAEYRRLIAEFQGEEE